MPVRAIPVLVTLVLVLGIAGPTPSCADQLWLAVDVPAELSGADRYPDEIVERNDLAYSQETSVADGAPIGALHLERSGAWLFAPAAPAQLGGIYYQTRDLVIKDGATYSLAFDGAAQGIPSFASIDAVMRDEQGRLVFSFDVPVKLDGSEFGSNDLILHDNGFSLYWDSSGAGVPAYANLTGASLRDDNVLIVTFDVPVLLEGSDYLPGDFIAVENGFSSYDPDGSWPAYAVVHALAFAPTIGPVPGAAGAGGAPLTVEKNGDGTLLLDWAASCGETADYAVYSGDMSNFEAHTMLHCTTGNATEKMLTPVSGAQYYLIVAHNGFREGSYGQVSSGAERSPASGQCFPQAAGSCY